MIQCDTCKCWQHGPCVGLWDEKVRRCPLLARLVAEHSLNRQSLCRPRALELTSLGRTSPTGVSQSLLLRAVQAQSARARRVRPVPPPPSRRRRTRSLRATPCLSCRHLTRPPTRSLLRKVNRKSSAPARGRSPSASLPPTAKHASSSSSVAQPTSAPHPKPRESLDAPVAAAAAAPPVVAHEPAPSAAEREREPAAAGTSGKAPAPGAPGGPEPKKRSTMNSRDAAYDDAIALSILEAGSAAMRARLERGGGKLSGDEGDESEDEVIEEIIVGPGRGRKKSAPVAERPSKSGSKKGAAGSKKGAKGCVCVSFFSLAASCEVAFDRGARAAEADAP